MASRRLESLGTLVRERRGSNKLRETATNIGISAATLMRVEGGKIPDVATFGKICKWLEIDPGSFLGFPATRAKEVTETNQLTYVSAHTRVDAVADPLTLQALAKMIILARNSQFEDH